MTFEEYRQHDALGLAQLVKNKEVNPLELLEIAIQRTENVNPKLNAVVHLLYDYGKKMLPNILLNSPFAGVPLLVKDLGLHIKGTPYNEGTRALKDYVSPHDNFVVQRLRESGFVFFGKTNTPEFGLTPFTESQLYGACYNPWNTAYSTGGSSGGAAAAVASGIVPLATASDGGGSIRIPASCCGLLGFKTTRGHSSFRPNATESWGGLVVEGCNSRSVRDTASYLDTISGKSIGEMHLKVPKSSFREVLNKHIPSLKIGFSTEHTLGLPVDKACKDAIQHTAKLLESLGHKVTEVPLPFERADLAEIFVTIVTSELAGDMQNLQKRLKRKLRRSDFESNTWAMKILGQKFSAGDYAHARFRMSEIAYRMGLWHKKYDILLTPTLSEPPIKTGALQNSKAEEILVRLVNTLNLGSLLKVTMSQFVDKSFGYIPYTPLANMTGQPSMSVPLYWTDKNLPIGSMFTAKIGADTILLQLAKQLETAQPWFDKIPARI